MHEDCNYNFASPLCRLCLMPMQTTKSYAPENKVKIHMIYELDIALRAVDGAIGHRPCEVSCTYNSYQRVRGLQRIKNKTWRILSRHTGKKEEVSLGGSPGGGTKVRAKVVVKYTSSN